MSNFYDELSLRGLVIIEDLKNNKTIVKKHNMILQDAKLILLNKLLENDNSVENPETIIKLDYTTYKPSKIRLGWSDSDVKYTDKIDKISGNIVDLEIHKERCEVVMDTTETYYVLKFTSNIEYISDGWKNINGEFDSVSYPYPKPDNILINTLGIVMSNNTSDMLFSRISFDPIVISPDSDLKLTYYVYF